MSKDSFYIKHDYNARNDQKILMLRLKFGAEGYGIFWMIVESMAEDSTGYLNKETVGGLSMGYGVAIGGLQAVLDYCVELKIFKLCEHRGYYSERVIEHKKEREFYKEAGSRGGKKKWENQRLTKTNPTPAITPPNTPAFSKERRGEERNILFETFWKEYPRRVGKGAAIKSWERLQHPDETLKNILVALAWQKKCRQWTESGGKYIPMPTTYLNQTRWMDEPEKPVTKTYESEY
jgi:hypothetical protein